MERRRNVLAHCRITLSYQRVPVKLGTISRLSAGAARRTIAEPGPTRPHTKGSAMSDKSPRQSMSKKSGKSLKEKRADKRAKAEHAPSVDVLKIKQR